METMHLIVDISCQVLAILCYCIYIFTSENRFGFLALWFLILTRSC